MGVEFKNIFYVCFVILAVILVLPLINAIWTVPEDGAWHNAEDIKVTLIGETKTDLQSWIDVEEDIASAYSLWDASRHESWHSASNIKIEIQGEDYDLQSYIDDDLIEWDVTKDVWHEARDIKITVGEEEEDLQEWINRRERPEEERELTFDISEASEDDWTKNCPLRTLRNRNPEQYAELKQDILAETLELKENENYTFYCSYDNGEDQITAIALGEEDVLIATASEKHRERINFWRFDFRKEYLGAEDNFGFYVALVDGKLRIKVKLIEGEDCEIEKIYIWQSVDAKRVYDTLEECCEAEGCFKTGYPFYRWYPTGSCRQTPRINTVCKEAKDKCPVYKVKKSGLLIDRLVDYYAWKDLSCTIQKS